MFMINKRFCCSSAFLWKIHCLSLLDSPEKGKEIVVCDVILLRFDIGGKRKDPSVGNTSGNNRRRINASTKQDPSYTHSFGFFLLLFLFLSDSLSCISLSLSLSPLYLHNFLSLFLFPSMSVYFCTNSLSLLVTFKSVNPK